MFITASLCAFLAFVGFFRCHMSFDAAICWLLCKYLTKPNYRYIIFYYGNAITIPNPTQKRFTTSS